MKKITLVGAAGVIGNSIGDALHREGKEYRVVGRNRASLEAAFRGDELAEIVTWNPDDADSARTAMRGASTLVYLVGVPYKAETELHCNGTPICPSCDGASRRNVREGLFANDTQLDERMVPRLVSSER